MKKYQEQTGLFCFNKGWKFYEGDFAITSNSNNHEDVYGFAKGGAVKGPASSAFDDSSWESVDLPHDWLVKKEFSKEARATQGGKSRGIGWYRFKFSLEEEDKGKQILIEFEGMSADATIFVNGMLLKRSFSGYNSFAVDMTDMAIYGKVPNILAIRIDASLWEGWWYEGAGIYRNVWMTKKSPVHLAYQGISLLTKEEKDLSQETRFELSFKLSIEAEVENSFEQAKNFTVIHTLLDAQGKECGTVKASQNVKGYAKTKTCTSLYVEQPNLWSIENPYRYQVKSVVVVDHIEVDAQIHEIGFRTLRFDSKSGFYLNGKSVKLKGVCNHQDHAGVGVAVPYKVKEYRIRQLKKLGANAYRCAHNPDPEILSICDELGMLVMEENRTFSSADYNLEEIKKIAKNAKNHPSVILYSVLNEEPLQGGLQGKRVAARLKASIREIDTTRPVLGAMNGGYLENEGATTALDVVGINYNPKMYDAFHEKYPDIPLVGSEITSAYMTRGEYKTDYEKNLIDDYDEDCALWGNTVQEGWKYVEERPFVMGGFVWTGFDYRGEPTPFEWPSVSTYFGTYDSCGFEKNACALYRAMWKEEPCIHISSPWERKLEIGKIVKVLLSSNCEEVELFVNGKSAGRKSMNAFEQAKYEIAYEGGELKAVGYHQGEICVEERQKTAGSANRIVIESVFDEIRDAEGEVGIFNISLVDEVGNIIPDAEELVYFEVENGQILGVGNGNPISHEPDLAPYRKFFHGRAQVIVKPHGEGNMQVRASVDSGLESTISLPILHTQNHPYVQAVEEIIVDGWRLYHKLFDEMPDITIKNSSNDMNSFEPVIFSGNPQPELSGKLNKYGMYRTTYDFGTGNKGRKIYFQEVYGYVYLYINEKLVASRTDAFGGSIEVEIDSNIEGKADIVLVVKNARKDYPEAGIIMPVTLVES